MSDYVYLLYEVNFTILTANLQQLALPRLYINGKTLEQDGEDTCTVCACACNVLFGCLLLIF